MKKLVFLIIVVILLIGCSLKDYEKIYLTEEEASYVLNFLADYLAFSDEGKLDARDAGFPEQFYLYKQDKVLSLGDMLLIFFQKQNNEGYFLLKDRDFELIGGASDAKEAHEMALNGKIPSKVGDEELHIYIYGSLINEKINKHYEIKNLNKKERKIPIAFTFDIESGRYVADNNGISPCEYDDYRLGLNEDENICDRPEYVAWMTPRDDSVSYTEYPYPQVSGLLGFKEILSYSEMYGIPTTNFIVKKDILAFEILDEGVVERAKKLVRDGLFEVGSHTRYHTHLSLVDERVARKELGESKIFLERFFHTMVYGFRAPYLSLLNDKETHANSVEEAGYSYYSSSIWNSATGPIINKAWNMDNYTAFMDTNDFKKAMSDNAYLITLDHPWNMVYRYEESVLVEDSSLKDKYRANILTALSNGGIPVLLKDLDINIY